MATHLLTNPFASSWLVWRVQRIHRERLTARGRYVFWLALALGFVGIDTREGLAFILFALAAGPLLGALLLGIRRAPRLRLDVTLPLRMTAGRPVTLRVRIAGEGVRARSPLLLSWGWRGRESKGLHFDPPEVYLTPPADAPAEARIVVRAAARGRYTLPSLGLGWTDPLGLTSSRRQSRPRQVVLAYPRFYGLDDLVLPVGRRYQPGGIPLASDLGDATEFVGTRDYREGDPLRRIHWRSWARRGAPVVKEYQAEYFSRIALLLDTYLPRHPRPADRRAFEAAISVLASVADRMSHSEEIVDVLAAGPALYEVSAGRSIGYLDNVLDVLACLEPCADPPFERLAAPLAQRLARITTVAAVVLDWDERREAFLRNLRGMGVALRIFIVREGPTTRSLDAVGDALGTITRLTPQEVEARLLAAEAV